MKQKNNVTRRLIIIASVSIAVIFAILGFTKQTKEIEPGNNSNVIILSVPSGCDNDTQIIVPIRELVVDNSKLNFAKLIKGDIKDKDSTTIATIEDACIRKFLDVLEVANGKTRLESISLKNLLGEECDYSMVNIKRLKFKCEIIAQQKNMTTYGKIFYGNDYFSINLYPNPKVS